MTNLRSFKRRLAIGIGVGMGVGVAAGIAVQSVGVPLGATIGAVFGVGIVWAQAASTDGKVKRWNRH